MVYARLAELKRVFKERNTACAVARCSQAQLLVLYPYDHHSVVVEGKAGVMLTYYLLENEGRLEPDELVVVFEHARHHPPAPPEVQQVIDELKFES